MIILMKGLFVPPKIILSLILKVTKGKRDIDDLLYLFLINYVYLSLSLSVTHSSWLSLSFQIYIFGTQAIGGK